jgi:tRNA pseudouridine32 synthase/23S rRNA pseudouridine746 synthase
MEPDETMPNDKLKPPPLLEIVHEDLDFVVVDKLSGMLSVPGRGPEKRDCVAERVREMYPGCPRQPAVHRLDMDTSGLIVVARNVETHRNLSIQFQRREIRKGYIALLDGVLEAESGTIELPFRLDVENRPHQIYDPVHGKVGITRWQKLSVEKGFTRIRFTPMTGRTHQLRVHAAHELGLGMPIVGDPLYGRGTGPGQLKLHAEKLGFQHPGSGRPLNFHSSPPF